MGDLDREMLLGYLMNALEDDEITYVERELLRDPKFRKELAALQEELSPLTYVYESVDPPKDLAKKTCSNLWATVDQSRKVGRFLDTAVESVVPTPHIMPIMADRSSVLEELLAVSPHHTDSLASAITVETTEAAPLENITKRLVRQSRPRTQQNSRTSRKTPTAKASPVVSDRKEKPRTFFGVVVSVAIGILIALIAFPALNYAKNQTHQYIVNKKLQKISTNPELFPQVSDEVASTEAETVPSQVNMAQCGWQEINTDQFPNLLVDNFSDRSDFDLNISDNIDLQRTLPDSFASSHFQPVSNSMLLTASENRGRNIILARQPNYSQPIGLGQYQSFDAQGFANQAWTPIVVQAENNPTVQTAYGQNVLFQNGRIFFRVLPTLTPRP